ncbi:MAG: AAA family ATPase [Desulfobacteraceae bacterium]|nr:AAA family ATPase [Desulfobacteraceae bacterium]
MKFPYGISDFYDIITQGYYYVDRTDRIPMIEETGRYLLFLRPRRFGKSLLLSMLKNYYDIARAEEFDKMFGNLAIGREPTSGRNQYFVLKWDFSAVSPAGGPEPIQQNLYDYINGRIRAFAIYYRDYLSYEITVNAGNAQDSFQSMLTAVQQTDHKLYLLIDEYDNFANEVMMGREIGEDRYKALVHGEGCLKALFKAVKSATEGEGLDRTFITGVSPVVMSDITSGHNIAKNVYLLPQFHDLCGFSESEIKHTLTGIVSECDFPAAKTDEALMMMRSFYDGYSFVNTGDSRIYNPTLALYFMEHFQDYCEYPEEMLDENLAADRGKIAYISRLPEGEQVIQDALNDRLIVQRLARRFGVDDMLYAVKDRSFMASLLWYLGVLTFGGRAQKGKHILHVPNLVIRSLYIERLQDMLLPAGSRNDAFQTADTFYSNGNMDPVCDFIEQNYFRALDNRDYRWANELTVKTAFLTMLFNDTYYITDSETALGREYADLTMIVRPDMRQYQLLDILIEFKYVSLKKSGLKGAEIRALSRDELKAHGAVKEKLAESKTGLESYCRSLRKKYGKAMHLKVFSVVSVGFDRLVWNEEKLDV